MSVGEEGTNEQACKTKNGWKESAEKETSVQRRNEELQIRPEREARRLEVESDVKCD